MHEAKSKILPGTWVFRRKRAPTGVIKKFKGQFCVRGDLQEGDFDIFAPVVAWATICLVLVFALTQGWRLICIDFNNAFIQAELAEPVWIHLPRGYKSTIVEFWGLPPLIPLLQYVNRLGFEICSVNRMNNRTRTLGYVNLNWPRCSARVTESLALTDGSFCQKQNTLYFRLCKNCEFMMCTLIVDHQFNRMHPWCS